MSAIVSIKATETGRSFYYDDQGSELICATCGSFVHIDYLQIHTDRHDKGL